MRALILGTDFAYDSEGNLRPIEINTNSALNKYTIENKEDIFKLDILENFIKEHDFNKITYIGALYYFDISLKDLCLNLDIEYEYIRKYSGISIPFIEDNEKHLIIRSAYDNTAIVDEDYCKVKINFLELIKNEQFKCEFGYINEDEKIVNNITKIPDNGNHPNFIVKAIYPQYDKDEYPKLYKLSSLDEVDEILENLDPAYFLTEFLFNPNKLYNGQMKIIRSFNMLFPPELKNIPIGQHIKLTSMKIDDESTFNTMSLELDSKHRGKYLTIDEGFLKPKLLDDDKVEMADGTFKTALELQNGDVIKTIIIPNPNDVDLVNDLANFGIDYNTFISGVTYSTNVILEKTKISKLTNVFKITFEDDTTWEDTEGSKYLALENGDVKFLSIGGGLPEHLLKVGVEVILIDTSVPNKVTSVLKKIKKIEEHSQIFEGWQFEVEETHVFLTQNEEGTSFAAIEHNPQIDCFDQYNCSQYSLACLKGEICCYGFCTT